MGFFDDLATGLEGVANAAVAVAPTVLNYFGQQQQKKAITKLAKSSFGTMPQLGLGYAASPVSSNIYGGYGGAVYGPSQGGAVDSSGIWSALGIDNSSVAGAVMQYAGANVPGPVRPRAVSGPFMAADPVTGQQVIVRKLGRPMLWSGDVAAFKRVRRVAGKLSKYAGHRRFR